MSLQILQLNRVAVLFSIAAALFSIQWSGCSTTTLMHPTSNAEMNAQLKGRNAIIKLKDGREWSVKEVNVSNDSVSWLNRDTDIKSRIAIEQLDKITTISTDHVLGALEGLGIGFVGTAAGIWALSRFSHEDDFQELYYWALIVVPSGGVIGLVVGAKSGFTYYDEFQLDERNVSKSDSLKSPYKGADSLSIIPSVGVPDTPMSASVSQAACDSCYTSWDDRPKQMYNLMFLTTIGPYYHLLPSDNAGVRGVADFGALVIIGANDAVGASLFASSDKTIPFNVGAELRYRRRLDSKQSLDFGIGLPIFGQSSLTEWVVSFYGLVKWNPVPWFGIALRPEMRRKGGPEFEYIWPGNQLVKIDDPYRFHLSVGIEIGGSVGR